LLTCFQTEKVENVKVLGVLLLLVLLALGGAAWLIYTPVAPPAETFLDFPSGTGSSDMAQMLQNAGVIRSRYTFLLLRIWKGGSLKAGEYRFADPDTAFNVYSRVRKGDVYTRAVTIPEGFNLYDIAGAIEAAGLGDRSSFLQAAHTNVDLIKVYAPTATSLEGYLFPDTYRFSHHTTARKMQEVMVHRFHQEATALGLTEPTTCAGTCPSLAETVTMASLVEKEVHFDDERALAAGVFENRLSRGMPLQTDPTVIYAALLANRWSGVIHRSDLDYDSPYNTYRNHGMPPGPICSPGAAALKAALHPAITDKLYFVADGNGHTQFSTGLQEHAEQVTAYRQTLAPATPPQKTHRSTPERHLKR
jgi:UPF0755 protein